MVTYVAQTSRTSQRWGDVFKWLLDRPDGDWPIALCAVCASILGFLGLWFVAKVIGSVYCVAPKAGRAVPRAASGDPKNRDQDR